MSGPAAAAVLVAAAAALLVTALAVAAAVRLRARHRARHHPVSHDPVTGLLDRAAFVAAAPGVLDAAPEGAVVVVEFGLAEQVVETLGHARGPAAVALAAERLRTVLAGADVPGLPAGSRIARLGGDTFAIAVGRIHPDAADAVFDRLRAHLAAVATVDGLPFEVPVALGVAVDDPGAGPDSGPGGPGGPDHCPRVAALLHRADLAMSAARRAGCGVRRYDPVLGERASRRRTLIRGFSEAVVEGQMRVYYQPLVSLDRGTVVGVEALARWEHPELGALLPDEFVPVLEASGQIDELTTFVLGEALGAARAWLDRDLRLSVAVNVSAGTVAAPGFPDRVATALETHGVPPELLTLELTESGFAAEREAARPALGRLHASGCRLAVDDFGTGQSSLAHLRRLPIDLLKIDKTFVLGMETERGDTAVVRAIVEMGHTLGMTVVAEGVERPAVRAALVEMGCDVAQGYLVSRPLPARSLDRWMATLPVAAAPSGEGGPLTLIA